MNTKIYDSIFSLLYAMVLIDNRVVKVEMDTFFARIESFLVDIEDLRTLRAKGFVANWFIKNYKNILRDMKTPNRVNFMLTHAERLKSYIHRAQVFEIMKIIAHADEDFHEEEYMFLQKVANIWGIVGSHVTVDEQ